MYFQQTPEYIVINDGAQTFTCTAAEFHQLEPAAPALTPGFTLRFWSIDRAYRSDGRTQVANDVDCGVFVTRLANYARRLAALRYTAGAAAVIDPHYHQLLTEETLL